MIRRLLADRGLDTSASDIFLGWTRDREGDDFMSVSFGMEKSNRRWKFMTKIGCCSTRMPADGSLLERTRSQQIPQ